MATKNDNNKSTTATTKVDETIPNNVVISLWVTLYRAVPEFHLPGTDFNISFSLLGAIYLYVVRRSLGQFLVLVLDWPADLAYIATGSLAAIVHSLQLMPGLYVALFQSGQAYQPTATLSTAPTWYQDLVTALLQFCTGYMIYDSVASFLLVKGFSGLAGTDFMFLGHHLATAIYMTQCRYLKAGHISAMICMLLGEFTNPFQNGNVVLNYAMATSCCNGPWMQQLDAVFEFGFAFFYFTIRAFIAPVFFAHVTFCLLFSETRTNVPLGMRVWWIFLIWAVEIGSYDWIMKCYEMLQEYSIFGGAGGISAEL